MIPPTEEGHIDLDARKIDLETEIYPAIQPATMLNKFQGCECKEPTANPVFTGFFRDGIRRIDLVLVTQDNSSTLEKIKLDFLMNAINTGLELELEPGVSTFYKHLLFIKVHGPDALIEEYGNYYETRKYFKSSHVEYIKENKFLLEYILPHLRIKYEKEWIKLMRMQNPGPLTYTTLERSTVVYKILQVITFGEPENFYGIDRLLANNVILDAYPLHDGPYFFLQMQDKAALNGRQTLFYNWIGYRNMFRSQPLNLIREYLGERLAFFFAFFEFYIRSLVFAAAVGLLVFIMSFYNNTYTSVNEAACKNYSFEFSTWFDKWGPVLTRLSAYTESDWSSVGTLYYNDGLGTHYLMHNYTEARWWGFGYITNWYKVYIYQYHKWDYITKKYRTFETARYDDMPVCPACRDMYTCPFLNLTEYCSEIHFKNWIDNPFSVIYAFFISIWGILLYLLWRRNEYYLCWAWETSFENATNTIRPEYRVEHKKSVLTGIYKISAVLATFLMRLLLTSSVIVIYVSTEFTTKHLQIFGVIPLLIALKYFIQTQIRDFDFTFGFFVVNYAVLVLISMINAFLILVIEKICIVIAYKFVSYMNHRTEDTYEQALVVKMYGFSFMVNFSFIFFMAFMKGQFYTYPADPYRWYLPLGIGVMNCGPQSCIAEVWVVVVVTMISKKIFSEAYNLLTRYVTDYNQGRSANENLPCWEKEYSLYQVDEKFFMAMYRDLLIQLAECTLFVFIFPLAPLFALLVNIWEIRHIASKLLLRCRRPMLFKTWGLGSWRIVLLGLPYVASFVNMLTISLNSNMIDAHVHSKYFNQTRYFVDYSMGVFNASDYANMKGPGSPHDFFIKSIVSGRFTPNYCLFPGKWNRRVESFEFQRMFDNSYTMTMGKWYVNWYQAIFFVLSQHMIVIIGLILHHTIEQCPIDIQETMILEHIVKTYKKPINLKKNQ